MKARNPAMDNHGATALAYPFSIVLSPNGEAKPLGTFGLLAYGAINAAPKRLHRNLQYRPFELPDDRSDEFPRWRGSSHSAHEEGLDGVTTKVAGHMSSQRERRWTADYDSTRRRRKTCRRRPSE